MWESFQGFWGVGVGVWGLTLALTLALHPVQHEHRRGGLAGQAEALAFGVLGAVCAAASERQQAEARLQAEAPLDEAVAVVVV